jgi:hypothetical protein
MIYPVRLGLTLGLIWATSVFLLAIINKTNLTGIHYAKRFFNGISSIYPACGSGKPADIAMCTAMAFGDTFSLGLFIGLIYNAIKIRV